MNPWQAEGGSGVTWCEGAWCSRDKLAADPDRRIASAPDDWPVLEEPCAARGAWELPSEGASAREPMVESGRACIEF